MVLFIEFQENAGDGRRGGGLWAYGYSAKRCSDPEVANPEVKVQVRDQVRVVGIVTPFAPRGGGGSVFRETFYRAKGSKWVQETCAGCPQQRYATGELGNVQGRACVGVSIRGKFVLSRTRTARKGSRHVSKRSSDPRYPTPKSKLRYGS